MSPGDKGTLQEGQAKSAVRRPSRGAKQRFFDHLMAA